MAVLELTATAGMEQRLWPALVALARILVLPAAELEVAVEREAEENPALEYEAKDRPECLVSCAWCEGAARRANLGLPAELAAPPVSDLLADASTLLSPREAELAEYVVASLDRRGMLVSSLAEIGNEVGASEVELQRVVAALRSVGPTSIAAEDLRASLLLQLDALAGAVPPIARRLVEDHLDKLAVGAFAAAARALGVTRSEVSEARDFIRSRLQPSVGFGGPPEPTAAVRPDIVVRELPDGALGVDIPDARHLRVTVNRLWREVADDAARPTGERALAIELVGRTRAFAARLADRRRTLHAIAELVVSRQEPFARGQGAPHPLTRAVIARAVGVHESTVSRAVAWKFVQLPSGRIVSFASFFRASLGAEEALARVIACEERPLSDTELATELALQGFPLARRTVTKYRTRLGIVPHTVR